MMIGCIVCFGIGLMAGIYLALAWVLHKARKRYEEGDYEFRGEKKNRNLDK